MRLTLDWDTDELKELHLPAVRERQPAQDNQRRLAEYVGEHADTGKWELWKSSSHGQDGKTGWHYIEYDLGGDLETMRRLRTAYGDDKLRISMDGKRIEWGSPFVQVMYHLKQIGKNEHKPYSTPYRAELVRREGFGDSENIKNEDGTLDYPKIARLLVEQGHFPSGAALYRRIKNRKNVEINTRASARYYDVKEGRRIKRPYSDSQRAETKALRDYAQSAGLGHYGEGDATEKPAELAEKPSRTTFHEYWEMPEIELGAQDFGEGDNDDESEWFPANVRTGTYDGVEEMTVKQVHDRVAERMVDALSPGTEVEIEKERDDGSKRTVREYRGLDLSRWDHAVSLERDRPLDPDEYARYRRIWHENQPNATPGQVREKCDRKGIDQFGENAVHWEIIVFDGEDALKSGGPTRYFWIARGVLDASDPDAVANPIRNSAIVADTRGWL